MKISVTLHGLSEEFLTPLNPRERSRIIREIVFEYISNHKDELYDILLKQTGKVGAINLLKTLQETSDAHIVQAEITKYKETNTNEAKKSMSNNTEENSQAISGTKDFQEYKEEGSVNLSTLKNEFSMTQ